MDLCARTTVLLMRNQSGMLDLLLFVFILSTSCRGRELSSPNEPTTPPASAELAPVAGPTALSVCGEPLPSALAGDVQVVLNKFPSGIQCMLCPTDQGFRSQSQPAPDKSAWLICLEPSSYGDSEEMRANLVEHESMHGWLYATGFPRPLAFEDIKKKATDFEKLFLVAFVNVYAVHRSIGAEESRLGVSEKFFAQRDWERDRNVHLHDERTYLQAIYLDNLRWRDIDVAHEAETRYRCLRDGDKVINMADDLDALWDRKRPANPEEITSTARDALTILAKYPANVPLDPIPNCKPRL